MLKAFDQNKTLYTEGTTMKRYKQLPAYKLRRVARENEVYIRRAVDHLAQLMDAASMEVTQEKWAEANHLGWAPQFKPLAH